MKEGAPGGSRTRGGTLPRDVVLFRKLDSWEIYTSRGEEALVITTTDYHPGPLYLSKEDLFEVLRQFDATVVVRPR